MRFVVSKSARRVQTFGVTYLHGYTEVEAARLRHQALHLAPYILFDRPLAGARRILEVGSGVGGQTAILVSQYPDSQITAVERERSSHDAAAHWLRQNPAFASRVEPIHADIRDLPESFPKHDAAFFCWVLEHCPDPISVLKATSRHLAPGARVLVHEVFNQSFDIRPSFPKVVRQYYDALNALQRSFGGDPNVGSALGQLLFDAGFTNIQITTPLIQLDDRDPRARESMFDYMAALLRSGESGLLQAGLITPSMGEEVEQALRALGRTVGVTFHYSIVRATANTPV